MRCAIPQDYSHRSKQNANGRSICTCVFSSFRISVCFLIVRFKGLKGEVLVTLSLLLQVLKQSLYLSLVCNALSKLFPNIYSLLGNSGVPLFVWEHFSASQFCWLCENERGCDSAFSKWESFYELCLM